MFLFVPLHQVQVVTGKATEGTYKGFSCMGLPYVGITSISWPPYGVTLWAGPLSNASHDNNNRLLRPLLFLHWWRGRHRVPLSNFRQQCWWWWCCLCWHSLPFKSPGPASSTASSNSFHPSTTVLCPSATSWCPAATFLTTTNKKWIEFNRFDTNMY